MLLQMGGVSNNGHITKWKIHLFVSKLEKKLLKFMVDDNNYVAILNILIKVQS